jgi:hypothetical protein
MKNKPDAMRIDSRRRNALLLANRVMLVIIGIVWIGMVVYRLAVGEYWKFLVSAVPMIALVWHGTYLVFKRHEEALPCTSSGGNASGVNTSSPPVGDQTGGPTNQQGQSNLPLPLPF